MAKQDDLTKVTLITVLGIAILIGTLFWLKGYKFNSQFKTTLYFNDVSGLEEGAIVRWSGLRVGVVENIKPILILPKKQTGKKPKNKYYELADKTKKDITDLRAKLLKEKDKLKKESIQSQIEVLKSYIEIYDSQGGAFDKQESKQQKSHAEVTIVITKKDVPLGPISRISIVPSGFLGDHYVEITPILNKNGSDKFDPLFVTVEPLRFERLLKANIESSEAFKEAIQKVNKLIKDEDVELLRATVADTKEVVSNVNKLINNATVLLGTTSEKLEQLAASSNSLSASVVKVGENINEIIGDEEIKSDLKETAAAINSITNEVAKLLDEEGLTNDVLEISRTAKVTSSEVSSFIADLRKTHEELDLPTTVSNLNSLAEKLDKLTADLNNVVADDEVKDDVKVTIKKARETSENLQKISKRLNKRFLLFRLLF